jgi:hypothetical protein
MGDKVRPESTAAIGELEDCPEPDASIAGFGETIKKSTTNKRAHAARTVGFVG